VANVTGEQGTAKSTLVEILRSIVDPNVVPLRAPPRDERDLYIAAGNSRVLAYDNLSYLPNWLSDALARLATGGGHATRMLYTDDDEKLIDAACPIIFNGIEDVVVKGDLADRAIALQLEPIPEDRRRKKKELWAEFERDRPLILGALLKAVARGLQRLPHVRLDKLPRMADFAEWAVACGDGFLWNPGEFIKAYRANINRVTRDVIEADPVANTIRNMMMSPKLPGAWSGTATELLNRLEGIVGEKEAKRKDWPGSARALSGRLRRAATPLRRFGIQIGRERAGHGRARIITITLDEKLRKFASASSAASAQSMSRTLKTRPNKRADGADHADAKMQTITLANANAVTGGPQWGNPRPPPHARPPHAGPPLPRPLHLRPRFPDRLARRGGHEDN
jgi:hypothetical protein